MVADTDPHVIGITESNKDIVDAELALTRRNSSFRMERSELYAAI